MILRFGYLSNTPDSTRRIIWVAVSTVKPHAARITIGKSGCSPYSRPPSPRMRIERMQVDRQ